MLEEDEKLYEEIEQMTIFVRISAPHKYKQKHDSQKILNELKERLDLLETLQEKINTLEEQIQELKVSKKT
jgi:hypothetical protein